MTSRSPVADDTTREALNVMWDALRRLDGCARVRQGFELSDQLRRTIEAGVRWRHPDYSEFELATATVRLLLGDELFRQVHPGVEIDA